MGPFELLTSFSGRIHRQAWWAGSLIIAVAGIVGSWFLDPGVWDVEPPRAPNLLFTLWEIAWMAPATAIAVKRFNDRDWPWWLGYAVASISIALIVAQQFGRMLDTKTAFIQEQVALVLIGAIWLFTFIENGISKGTSGPNRYGPDPLG